MHRTLSQRNQPVLADHFAMIPRNDVPRSTFRSTHTHKTTFNAGYLVPIHVDEVLPGDVHRGTLHVFARLATPIFPIMDSLELETFFFFVPMRLVWDNFQKFMGEQANPGDSIAYTVPTTTLTAASSTPCAIFDYFGLPVAGQFAAGGTVPVNALPLRAYNLIWNEWFRDENLQTSTVVPTGNGPDAPSTFNLLRRNKRHDYFTSALPWPQKGGAAVTMPLAGTAPINYSGDGSGVTVYDTGTSSYKNLYATLTGDPVVAGDYLTTIKTGPDGQTERLYADLSQATGATINAIRTAVTIQQFLERDARGGTRYTEILRNHFGVTPQDARLQRPEYIGGGRSVVQTQAIPQTSATGITGGSSPTGALAGASIITGQHEFSYSAQEHGYIIGLANVSANLTWQQGLHRMWTRSTRYDFYWPVFANLGEQTIRQDEIYVRGDSGDSTAWGYQERWAEYRYYPSRISGLFRSTSSGNIDEWHLAIQYSSTPSLNSTFIQDISDTPLTRAIAAGGTAAGMQILLDSVWSLARTRAIPTYSVPGLLRF